MVGYGGMDGMGFENAGMLSCVSVCVCAAVVFVCLFLVGFRGIEPVRSAAPVR